MKKILMLLLAVMLVFTACGKKNEKKTEEVKTPQATERKQDETKTPETNDVESSPEQPAEETQGEAVQIDGEEFENLLGDYENAKKSGDAEAERAALDQIQKILEQVQ